MTDTLFGPDAAPPDPGTSPDRRRTIRQRDAIAGGVHPLGLVHRGVRIHPDAPRPTGPGGDEPGPRCGGCVFRQSLGHHDRAYAKCAHGAVEVARTGYPGRPYTTTEYPRASHGAATDVRAWWPACTDWQAEA